MTRLFSALFNIRPAEWPRLLLLYGMGLLFLIGMTWGSTIAEASFLQQVGVGFLPLTFAANALISIIAIAVYTAFVDHIPNDKLLVALLLICAATIVIGRGLIALRLLTIAYPLLYLLSRVILDTFNLHWWTYVNGFYDTQASKRVSPFISTGGRLAGIIGGLTTPLLTRLMPHANIILLWAAALVIVALAAQLMPRLLNETKNTMGYTPPVTLAASGSGGTTYIRNIREGYRFVSQSTFLRWMAVSTFLLMVLFTLLTYQTGQILLDQLKTTEAISSFTGTLTGLTNLIMLPIQLLLLGRLVSRVGLGNANLAFPVGTLAICGALVVLPPQIFTAGLAYFDQTTFRTAFRNTVDNMLYNAVPLRVKGRARAFIGGLVVPIATLIGGGLLRILPGTPWLLPMLIGLLSIGYAVSTLVIRRQYTQALVSMLEQEDFSFLLDAASDLSVPDAATLNWLKKKMEDSTSNELTIFMAKLLSEVGGDQTVPILIEAARTGDAQVRASIIDSLVAADFRGDEVRNLFTTSLSDPDGHVRQSAIAGLKQGANQNSEQFLALALELARDPSMEVRIQVLPPLFRSGDVYYVAGAIQALTPILSNTDPLWRARGVQILGQARDPRFIKTLLEYLSDADDEVRLEAATGIETLSQTAIPKSLVEALQTQLGRLLFDPIERVRQAALTILGRINTPDTQQILISFLTDASPEIRDAAVRALVQIGKPVIPVISEKLNSDNLELRKMVTVVLSRIDRERAIDLLRSYVQNNLIAIYGNQVRLGALAECSGYRSISILQSVLRERNQQLLAESFYLLSAIHDKKNIRVIADSLNSDNARTRANAIEAVESLATPQIAKLIAPLFDRELPPEKLLTISKEISGIRSSTAEVMRQLAADPADPWLRAIMNFALGEIGVSAFEIGVSKTQPLPVSAPPIEADKPRGRRVRSSLDLFGAITGDAPQKEEKKEEKPALSSCQSIFSRNELEAMFRMAANDPAPEVQLAARSASRMIAGLSLSEMFQTQQTQQAHLGPQIQPGQGEWMLSTIEKIIFLKEVSFFGGMTVDQLKILASVCEEEVFNEDTVIFNEGDLGGALYVVVRGRVGIEREAGARKGSTLRIGTIQAYSYFGEMTLFDNSPRTEKAVAIQDTLTLRLRREPLIALTRQYPDLSLKLINVLSQRLREANDRIAQLSTAKPRELQKVFDKLG